MAGWNGSGTFVRLYNWVTDKANSIKITASRMDGEFDNYKTGLENCLTRDGQNSPSANLPMAGHKHTGAGIATALGEYLAFDQLRYGVVTCTGGAGSITFSPAFPTSCDALVLTPGSITPAMASASTVTRLGSLVFLYSDSGSSLTGSVYYIAVGH